MSESLSNLEDDLASLQRRRALAALDLSFAELTPEQSITVDAVCDLLPMVDDPGLLRFVSADGQKAIRAVLHTLPQTRAIERLLEHWPQ